MLAAFGAWLSPVERTVRVREVPSSNLGTPTARIKSPHRLSGDFLFPNIGHPHAIEILLHKERRKSSSWLPDRRAIILGRTVDNRSGSVDSKKDVII